MISNFCFLVLPKHDITKNPTKYQLKKLETAEIQKFAKADKELICVIQPFYITVIQ